MTADATKLQMGETGSTDPSALPCVSFIVITRDRADELRECLLTLLAQRYRPFEVVVVDNASSDETCKLVEQEFPTVRLVRLATNEGVPGGRNRGVEAARGVLCCFIDDDARLPDAEATARMVRYFQEDPRLACLALTIVDPSGAEPRQSIPRADKRVMPGDYASAYFCGAGFVLRRQEFLDAGMFWEPLAYAGEELDLSYRLLDRGYHILHTRDVQVVHREVSTARPTGQYIYFNARGRPWVATRNLPWVYVLGTTVLWWGHTGMRALRDRQLGSFFRGVFDSLRGLPRAWRERRAVRSATVQLLQERSGRLWF